MLPTKQIILLFIVQWILCLRAKSTSLSKLTQSMFEFIVFLAKDYEKERAH